MLLDALQWAFLAVGIVTIVELVWSRTSVSFTAITGILTFTGVALLNGGFIWLFLPPATGAGQAWIPIVDFVIAALVFAIVVGYDTDELSSGAIAGLAGGCVLLLFAGILSGLPYGEETANQLKSLLTVEMVKPDPKNPATQYPNTNEEHIPLVGPQAARHTGEQALNSQGLGTRLDLGEGNREIVNGTLYYIFELIADYSNGNALKGKVPGYIAVNAEDPNEPPIAKVGYNIDYWHDGWFENSVERYLYEKFPDYYIDDLNLEVDDQWQPYYVGTLNRPPTAWEESVPRAFILMDPQTGKVTRFALDKVPAWVDRVYSEATAELMLNWWGRWQAAEYKAANQGTNNRYKVSAPTNEEGEELPVSLNLVYTDEGPAWQALMVSYRNDSAVYYVALMHTRTGKVRVWPAPKGLITETRVVEVFNKSQNNPKSLDPSDLTLYQIYGKLIWGGGLVSNGSATQTGEDGYPKKESYNGFGILDAQNADAAKVIIATSKSDALAQLSAQIATGNNNVAPTRNSSLKTVKATVAKASQPITLNGRTFIIFQMEGDPRLFRAPISETPASLTMALAGRGDKVIITFVDTKEQIHNITSLSFSEATPTPSPTN